MNIYSGISRIITNLEKSTKPVYFKPGYPNAPIDRIHGIQQREHSYTRSIRPLREGVVPSETKSLGKPERTGAVQNADAWNAEVNYLSPVQNNTVMQVASETKGRSLDIYA